jgi:ATP-dependent helicase HrpB
MAKRWAEDAGGDKRQARSNRRRRDSVRWPIRIALRANRGGDGRVSLLANGRGAQVDPAAALAREPFIVVCRTHGKAAQGKILLAAPIAAEEIEQALSRIRFERRAPKVHVRSGDARRCARARPASSAAIALSEQMAYGETGRDHGRAILVGRRDQARPATPAVEPKALSQWREREMYLRKAEGERNGHDLSDGGAFRRAADENFFGGGGRRLFEARRLWLVSARTNFPNAVHGSAALECAPPPPPPPRPPPPPPRLDAEAPTHIEAPTGTQPRSITARKPDRRSPSACRILFGSSAEHPAIAGGRVPLVIESCSLACAPCPVAW